MTAEPPPQAPHSPPPPASLAPHRFARWFLGPRPVSRLTATHCVHGAAEAFFTVSMAGSIFFSVSPDAARPRVLLFLMLTLTPFLVMAPLFGPFVDRVRGGLGTTIVATFALRAALALMLAGNLRNLLLFPLAFAIMVVAKTYTVSRNALVPELVGADDDLVSVNARLSRSATIVSSIAAGGAGVLYQLTSAAWVLRAAAVLYVVAACVAWWLRRAAGAVRPARAEAVGELIRPDVSDARWAMTALRAAIGFALFHVGFSLRADAEPAWMLGAVIGANGLGAFVGSVLAPPLRRRYPERTMVSLALAAAAVTAVIAGVALDLVTLVAAMLVLGTAGSVTRRALDAIVQRQAPHARGGSVYAWLETRFELAWVLGACLAVASRVATWVGMVGLAAFLTLNALIQLRRHYGLTVLDPVVSTSLPERLVGHAETLFSHHRYDEAIAVARAAADVPPVDGADADAARAAIEAARQAIAHPHARGG